MTSGPFPGYAAQLSDFIARCGSMTSGSPAFTQLALQLFRIQFEHNPAYGIFCRSRGISPDNVTSVSELPAVPVSAFKELEFTCVPSDQRTAVFHSSGTSGQRLSRHFHNELSLEIYEKSLLTWFQCQFPRGLGSRAFAFLTPFPGSVPNSSLVHMLEALRCAYQAPEKCYFAEVGEDNSWNLDLPRLREFLLRAVRLGTPLFVFGTAFSFVHLLDDLEGQGTVLRLPPGSRVMETGGYKGRSRAVPKAELHAGLTRWLAIKPEEVLCEYGMSELSSQAYDAPAAGCRWFRFPPWARATVVSPETGCEVGDGGAGVLRVLDLANIASVVAVETQDLAIRRGDAFELVGRIADAESRGCSLMAA